MFALTTSPWATECEVLLTVSNLVGSEVLVLSAGLYLEPDSVAVVGFCSEKFVERHRTGADLVLVQNDDIPDKIYTAAGGSFLVGAEIRTS